MYHILCDLGGREVRLVTDVGDGFECNDQAACMAWKALSVVGIALGAGFLLSLLIPFFSYGVCCSIGLLVNCKFHSGIILTG